MKKFGFVLLCLCPCLAQQDRGDLGSVSGTLVGDDGTPIVGGHVSLHLLSPSLRGRYRHTQWSAQSGTGGSFQFNGLSVGSYRLCAQIPRSTWLNPCEWGLQSLLTSVSAEQRRTNVTMVLKKGVALPIRIDDAGHFLSQDEGRRPGAHLLLGVPTDAQTFHPAAVVSQDASGRDYQIVVPFNATVKIVVYSSYFLLGDAAGTPLARSAVHITTFVQAGQVPPTLTLRVLGGDSR